MKDHRTHPRSPGRIHTQNPCVRCVHMERCTTLLNRLADALEDECNHQPQGYDPPTVIVDCEGRFTPSARHRPLEVH